jgi:Fe-S cluster assembly iron-binding protein IscA
MILTSIIDKYLLDIKLQNKEVLEENTISNIITIKNTEYINTYSITYTDNIMSPEFNSQTVTINEQPIS